MDRADSATIGTLLQRVSFLTASANSKPLIPGISISETIKSKSSPASHSSRAAAALSTQVTSYPATESSGESRLRKNGLSSTSRSRDSVAWPKDSVASPPNQSWNAWVR